jgi:cysteine desulfurase
VEEISKICRKYGAFFHCDGVQGFVREPLDFSQDLYGSYVLSSHKLYGLKGFGVLVVGDGLLSTRISPPYHGGGHERGMRPGTLNTLAIAAGATSISLHNKKRKERLAHMSSCANAFIDQLQAELPEMRLTLPMDDRATGIVNFYIPGIDAPTLLAAMPDICINRGASCIGSGGEAFSHVPKALGFPIEIQANVLRASFGEAISVQGSQKAAVLISQRTKNLR